MRRRLDLAVTLLLAPQVLFLDEPTTGLDPRNRAEVVVRPGDDLAVATALLAEVGGTPPEPDPDTGRVAVVVREPVVALTRVLAGLAAAGVEPTDVGLRRPTLDDVFRRLTGHRAGAREGAAHAGGGDAGGGVSAGTATTVAVPGGPLPAVPAGRLRRAVRDMPIAPSAVVVGRALAAMLYSVASLLLMVGCGLAIGWRWNGSTTGALAAFGLLLLLRFAFLWVGILLGLKARTPEAANSVFGLLYPVTMLSNAFVAPELMLRWLAVAVEWNPLSSTITTTRELFGNPVGAATSWPGEPAAALSVVWPVLLTAVFLPLAVRAYRGLSR